MAEYWTKIAESASEILFNNKGLAEVQVGNKVVCIARYKEQLFAFAAKCPHASGLLVNGWVDAMGNVVCPLHHYKFCLKNGRNISGEGYQLKHWRVEIRKSGVWVALQESG